MKKILFLVAFINFFWIVLPQTVVLNGYVCDTFSKESLPLASVITENEVQSTLTDRNGHFALHLPQGDSVALEIRFLGYEPWKGSIVLAADSTLHFHLYPFSYSLHEVVISSKKEPSLTISALSVHDIDRSFFTKNNASSFSKSLSRLAGISSMDIGPGISKPVIRGMGFNRISVVDKGVIQQNQQWGADHGLDIDQYDIDRVLIHKGPLSLYYGSDAMGGVIEILPVAVPAQDMTWGDVSLISKSNNGLWGITTMAGKKSGNWFLRGRLTAQTFADYRIPADSINYLTWKLPIHARRMKNTAGRELNSSLAVNYTRNRFSSWTYLSNYYTRNGFYPGAHGVPNLERLVLDGDFYNIGFPYTSSNHFKVSNITNVGFESTLLYLNIGFQENTRNEMSKFHTHYFTQSPPEIDPDKELSFRLKTFSANGRITFDRDTSWRHVWGVSGEIQHNRVGGYSFLLPHFERYSAGVFGTSSFKLSPKLTLTGGLRFDFGRLNIHGFYDETLFRFLILNGYDTPDAQFYARRADDLNKKFRSFSGIWGMIADLNKNNSLKINFGRSFRFPTAGELAANGVHHGAFRHEKGNSGLNPETGWQLDAGYSLTKKDYQLSVNLFGAYFSNYIYLNPTGIWSALPHTGQIYEYTQSRVFLAGGEIEVGYHLGDNLQLESNIEYVYNQNLNNKYPLPFSPPLTIVSSLTYANHGKGALTQYSVGLENECILAQNRIATNELKTPGASLFGILCSMNWSVKNFRFFTNLHVRNLLDTPFYNHLSFYRKLNVPEPGRNIQFILKIPFY